MTNRRILESTEELCMKLRHMKLSGMADELGQNNDPNHDLVSFDERLNGIINAEWNLRYNKKLNRFIKKATLRYPEADLDDSIYNPARQLDTDTIERLSKCSWIEEGRNLLIPPAAVNHTLPMRCAYVRYDSSRLFAIVKPARSYTNLKRRILRRLTWNTYPN